MTRSNAYAAGEVARIVECAPRSKLKTWEVMPKAEPVQPEAAA